MRGLWIVALVLAVRAAAGAGFDHYLLAVSWTPSWCVAEGDARGDARCAEGADAGWLVHGLWPQHAQGWPEFCTTAARDPSRAQTRAMTDIMGSAGLAWHQWRKHGRCSGLNAAAYFATTREAFARLAFLAPEATTVEGLTRALKAANPGLTAEDFVITCRGNHLAEVRLCLTPWLAPRTCTPDVRARACDGALTVPATR